MPTNSSREPSFSGTARWLGLWLVSYLAVTFLFKTYVLLPGRGAWFPALIPTAVGLIAFWRYSVFLSRSSATVSRVHLGALSLAAVAGGLTTLGYRLLERAGAPRIDPNDPAIVMLVAWAVGILWLARREARSDG